METARVLLIASLEKKRTLYMFFIANIKIWDWDISDTAKKLPCLQVVHIVNIRIRLKETFETNCCKI